MSATEIKPLPTPAELRDVEECLQDAFDRLESVAWVIKEHADRFGESHELDPSANYDYLGRVFECLDTVQVQLAQLKDQRRELRRQAHELAVVIRHKAEMSPDA